MKGRTEEAEVIIRLDQQDGMAHVNVHAWPAMYRKMFKLFGQSKDGANPGWSARWVVPKEAILIRKGKRKSSEGARARGFALGARVQRKSEGEVVK